MRTSDIALLALGIGLPLASAPGLADEPTVPLPRLKPALQASAIIPAPAGGARFDLALDGEASRVHQAGHRKPAFAVAGGFTNEVERRRRALARSPEYRANYGLGTIRAAHANAAGLTGAGVTVAVVDSGIDPNHPEFRGAIDPRSADAYGRPMGDAVGHGTGVASVVAARRDGRGVQGVAPEATVMAVRIDAPPGVCGGCVFEPRMIAAATNYAAAGGARVINYSLSMGVTQEMVRALGNATAANAVMVFSAGNNGEAEPRFPGRAAHLLNGQGIIVGAVDRQNRIARFSNHAGRWWNYYLVAPGVNVPVAKPGGGYGKANGTSFSAPHVADAAAVLLQVSPFLSARQVARLLLETATDLGAPGPDPVYGRGLVNLKRALRPQGPQSVPTGSRVGEGGARLAETTLRLGGAFGRALADHPLLERAIFLDGFGRPYGVDLGRAVGGGRGSFDLAAWQEPRPRLPFGHPEGRPGAFRTHLETSVTGLDARWSSPEQQSAELERFALTGSIVPGTDVALTRRLGLADYFGLVTADTGAFDGLTNEDAFTSPYLGLVEDGDGLAVGQALGAGFELRIGIASRSADGDRLLGQGERALHVAELRRTFSGGASLGLQLGELREAGGLLDTAAAGAFALGGEARTTFVGLSGHLPLGERFELFGQATMGWTEADGAASGLVRDVSTLESVAFGVGGAVRDLVTDDDRLTLTLAQPLRITQGEATLDVPVGRADDGTIRREQARAGLAPGGRELDLELAYQADLAPNQRLRINLVTRLEPGHDRKAEPEHFVGVRYSLRF